MLAGTSLRPTISSRPFRLYPTIIFQKGDYAYGVGVLISWDIKVYSTGFDEHFHDG